MLFALLVVSVTVTSAQQCASITVSYPGPAPNDDGHGPGFFLSFQDADHGTQWLNEPSGNFYSVRALNHMSFPPGTIKGYINAYNAIYNGCPLPWSLGGDTKATFYDATLHQNVVNGDCLHDGYPPQNVCIWSQGEAPYAGAQCDVNNCAFSSAMTNLPSGSYPIITAHDYVLTYFFKATVTAIDSVWYPCPGTGCLNASITIRSLR